MLHEDPDPSRRCPGYKVESMYGIRTERVQAWTSKLCVFT